MHPSIQHKELWLKWSDTAGKEGMLFPPLLLSQSHPQVHNTRPAAPSPPVKD